MVLPLIWKLRSPKDGLGAILRAKIVETEAYLGCEDKAAHSFNGRKTLKNEAMFMQPGTIYVYNIHTHVCMNISSQGDGAAVLIRALEPIEGLSYMQELRSKKRKSGFKALKDRDLTNGPGKLTCAMDIDKNHFNKKDVVNNCDIWIEFGNVIDSNDIVCSPRINIDYAEEWKDKELRFYLENNSFVSKK